MPAAPCDRHVLERLEHGHDVERLTRERQPLRQVGPAHIGHDRTRRMCDRPSTRVDAFRVDIELAQRFDHEARAHPASSTRLTGKKRHSRYAATSAFDVARVYCS